jgi:hypothetical protein
MRARPQFAVPAACLVAVAALFALSMSSGGASARTGTRTIHLVANLSVGEEVDLGAPGRSVGDEYVFGGRLTSDSGRRLGRLHGYCVLTDLSRNAGECVMTALLPHGQISVQGVQTGIPTPAEAKNAIVGGTGAFRTAHGQVSLRLLTPATLDLTFQLIA